MQGKVVGTVEGVRIDSYSQSGRVSSLTILGTKGEYTVTKENTRTFFNGSNDGSLKSRMYQFVPYSGSNTPNVSIKPGTSSTGKATIITSDGTVEMDLEGLWIETEVTYRSKGS